MAHDHDQHGPEHGSPAPDAAGGHTDEWFRHASDEALPATEHGSHVSAKALGVTFVTITFGVLFVVLVLVAYFNSYNTNLRAEKQEGIETADPYLAYRSASRSRLASSGVIDREAGTAYVPIERAMESVIEAYDTPERASLPAWRRAGGPIDRRLASDAALTPAGGGG